MIIRAITRDDLERNYWGKTPVQRTVRGFVAEKDGELLGMAFLMYLPHAVCAFAEMKEGGEKYPLSIMRIVRKMQALMRGTIAPIFAVADEQYPNSGAFLERCGFEHIGGRQYCFKQGRE